MTKNQKDKIDDLFYYSPINTEKTIQKEQKRKTKEREKRIKKQNSQKKAENQFDYDNEMVIKMTNKNNQRQEEQTKQKMSKKQRQILKKKILVCMLWLCAIACFTGFPWIFFSWDVIHSYMGIHDIPSDLTIVLFREECLFFGFFCIYFLFLRNIEKYKGLISFCSFLVAFMGGFMYLLKLQTGIVHISSDYEPFIWLIIGSFIFYLNHSINGIAPKKQKLPVLSCLFQVQAGVLLLNIVNILVPEQTWKIMFNISYSTVSPYDKYTFGMISGFTAFSSIIIYYISNRILFFMNLSKAILIFSFLYFLGFFVWGNFSELYKPLFILYVVLVEILNIVGINYIFKRRIYEK